MTDTENEYLKVKALKEQVALRFEIVRLRKEFEQINAELLDLYRAEQRLIENPEKYFNDLEND